MQDTEYRAHLEKAWWDVIVIAKELHSENVRNSSAYKRLKLAMDYWCVSLNVS